MSSTLGPLNQGASHSLSTHLPSDLSSQVLAVSSGLPIRTDSPVHEGKVRAVYWLTQKVWACELKQCIPSATTNATPPSPPPPLPPQAHTTSTHTCPPHTYAVSLIGRTGQPNDTPTDPACQDSDRLVAERGYDVAAGSQLAVMVISDRISAYEAIWHAEGGMNGVPGKGAALNVRLSPPPQNCMLHLVGCAWCAHNLAIRFTALATTKVT